MVLDRIMEPGRLAEKPWKLDALVRFALALAICMFGGTLLGATIVRYFDGPHHAATPGFLCLAAGIFACLAGAVIVLVRPWPFENFLKKLLSLLLCIYGGFFQMWLAYRLVDQKTEIRNPAIEMLIGILAFQGMAVVLAHFFLREHHTGWAEGFGFDIDTGYALVFGVIAGLCALPATWGLEMISNYVLQRLTLHPQEQEAVQILRNTDGWQNRVVLGIGTIIIAPIAEEILFRGILYPSIKRLGYPKLAWWVTALVFAAVHTNVATFVPLAFLAFVLIWLYENTGNLLTCIVAHSLFNAANFIALYFVGN